MRNRKSGFFYLAFCLCSVFLTACAREAFNVDVRGEIYGTYYHIKYCHTEDITRELSHEMKRVDASLSLFNPSSVLSRINRGESDDTDTLFRRVFRQAQKVYWETDGAYDITIAPLVNAWGFGPGEERLPDSARIDSLRRLVGMSKAQLQEEKLVCRISGMQWDAGSIAKGLGVDLVAECLERHGVQSYMVEIGGEVRVKGMNDRRKPWRIGIDRPEDDPAAQSRELQMILKMTEGALATSGNYRNFYLHEGRKYAHTIHPLTGYPVQTDILSASVYASSCMAADAYATAFMVTGAERAKRLIEKNPGLEGCLIYEENGSLKTWISEGLKAKVVSPDE